MFMRPWKGFWNRRILAKILKYIGDTFVKIQSTFRYMVIQSFLKLGEFWINSPFLFRVMGYFLKYLQGYGILWAPFQGLIYILFGSKLYGQIVGISMGINCAPLVADLFWLCYERDFMLSLSGNNHAGVVEAFNYTSYYLGDLLNIDIQSKQGCKDKESLNQVRHLTLETNGKVTNSL